MTIDLPPTEPIDPKRIATAFHEAGHATMALLLGRDIQKVTIEAGQTAGGIGRLGLCQIKKGKLRSSKDWLEDEILILLAGMVAEARVTGEYCPLGANEDLRGVRRYALMRGGSDRQVDRLERRMLDKTEHLLFDTNTWTALESIAQALLESNTISGRAARHLYDRANSE